MGTCCSRSTSDGIIVYPTGIKIPDPSEVGTQINNVDPRYTPDPNRPGTQLKRGADFIRTPTTPLAIPRARTKSGDSRSSSFRERDSLQEAPPPPSESEEDISSDRRLSDHWKCLPNFLMKGAVPPKIQASQDVYHLWTSVHSGRVRTISGGSYSLNDMDTSQVDLPRAHLRSGEGGRSSVRQVELKDHPSRRIVVAVYNYQARERADVSFMKGDRMEVLDDTESDWWRVKHLRSGVEGLIPWNFVAEEKSVESEDWFFGKVLRKEAEKLLLSDENPRGTFLVRYSEHNPDGFSLSVKDWEETRGYHVKHYKIKPLDNGGYYIATNQTFATLQALVMAYTKNALGLCHVLACPCPKPKPHLWDLSPDMRDQWEIDRSEIHLIKKLGHGNFGEVWYGKWKNNIEVAVKTLRQGTMSTAAFLQEASIMKKFRHDRLVALYAVCSKEEPVYIVQEFMCNGSLLEFLRNGSGRKLMFGDLIYIAAQIASGMEYLEAKQLIHRDLAARNVLIGENNIAKICDFGLARVIEDDEYCPRQGSRFPVKWTAPEAIVYGRFSIKSDVWSYGILLMELFTYGQVPYPGMHGREVIEHVEKGYRMPNPSSHHIPEAIYRLMLNCWDADPEKRPTFEFLNHYFEDFTITSEMPYREVVD